MSPYFMARGGGGGGGGAIGEKHIRVYIVI